MTMPWPSLGARRAAADWFARLKAPGAGGAERAHYARWRLGDPAHARAYDEVETVWNRAGEVADDPVIQALIADADRRYPPAPRRGAGIERRAAAVLLICGLLGLGAGATTPIGRGLMGMAPPPVIYETEVGERRLAALADGSVLHLDAASRVRADVGGSRRRVELLAGRARFDVAKDSWRRPFRVEAGGINVTALGTLFDVRLNAADVRVALFEGAVEVRREADSAQAVRLRPGQGLVAPADGGPFHLKNVEDAQAESWTEGRLMFSGVPLSSVAEELNRYSRRKLIVESSALGDKQFRGVLAAGDIDAAAEALAEIYSLRVRRSETGDLRLTAR